MSQFFNGILILFVISSVNYTTGYKWITLKSNDSIPVNAIKVNDYLLNRYVGRAIHYNLVVPAEVYNSSYAVISYDEKEIVKRQFEVLVATEHCEWTKLGSIKNVPENIVHGGSAWNSEPIYIGKTTYSLSSHIASILIGSNQYKVWEFYNDIFGLICVDNSTWVEASSGNIPNNTVLGGLWGNSTEFFVGRLLGPSSWLPAVVVPTDNSTSAVYEDHEVESLYCQVLVGDTNQYKWHPSENGQIPDYAVVGGQSENGEIRYVAKVRNSVTYIVPSRASRLYYEILVKNF